MKEMNRSIRGNLPNPSILGDHVALDFLNSVSTSVHAKMEWLANGDDLLGWLEQARLLSGEVAAAYRTNSLPGELDAVCAQARALREWFRTFVLAHNRSPVEADVLRELQPLNLVLARDETFRKIVARGTPSDRNTRAPVSGLEYQEDRRWRSPESLLLPIARAMADLVCTADLSQVKQCEGPACSMVFLDTTHGHGRRWCRMAVCGNRAKQASHRKRKQA